MLLAASFVLLAVLALGYLIASWVDECDLSFQSLGNAWGLGLLAWFSIGLLAPALSALVWIAVPLMAAFAWQIVRDGRRLGRRFFCGVDGAGGLLVAVLLAALASKTVADAIGAWDARSIWYFHAKVAFYADRLLGSDLWTAPAMRWAHGDYPKLNAFLAATWMRWFGGWNELLPKFSLALLAVPATLLCVGFTEALVTRLLLLTLFFLRSGDQLWTGYMDGWLATYAGIAVLYASRFMSQGRRRDLLTVLVAAGVGSGLKNEGMALAALILTMTVGGRWLYARRSQARLPGWDLRWIAERQPGMLVAAAVAFLPLVIWQGWKLYAGVENDLAAAGSLSDRLMERVTDQGAWSAIWHGLFPHGEVAMLRVLAVAALVFAFLNRKAAAQNGRALTVALGVGLLYLCLLLLVYLTTPYDLAWHLSTSVDRTRQALHTVCGAAVIGFITIRPRRSFEDLP